MSADNSPKKGILDAIKTQHPNLSVFRDSSATPEAGPSSSPDQDSPSVKALESKLLLSLKPGKRTSIGDSWLNEAKGSDDDSEERSRGSFIIQGLSSSTQSTTTPDKRPKAGNPRHKLTPAVNRIISGSRGGTSSSPDRPFTPSSPVKGILRIPATPGTGSSVRFGKRLYDDGDESAMSASIENSPEQRLPSLQAENAQEAVEEEEDVDWSLSFNSPRRKAMSEELDNVAGSPYQVSLPSLNGSPDHDQIQAIKDLSSSADDENADDSSRFDRSASWDAIRSQEPASSPTVRIPLSAQPASPDQATAAASQPPAPLNDLSESNLFGLQTDIQEEGNLSNIVDLSITSLPRMDASSITDLRKLVSSRFSSMRERRPKTSNDSMPSSFSNDSIDQSFSESFLREAGAGMLAGLDEEMKHSSPRSEQHFVAETPRPGRMVDFTSEVANGDNGNEQDAVVHDEAVEQTPMPRRDSPARPAPRSPSPKQDSPAEPQNTSPAPESKPPSPSSPSNAASPSLSGFMSFLPSPRTPNGSSRQSAPQTPATERQTPGEVSMATTAADYATPQWTGPTACGPSADLSSSSFSIDASPSREKAERRLIPFGQLAFRPGATVPWQAGSPTADLEEIVTIISQLDQAHTEHGSYLVSRVQQAEAKFTLLSEALKFSHLEKERLSNDYSVACDKVEALQGKMDEILQEYEESKRTNRNKDDEVEALVRKLTSQIERRGKEDAWKERSEEMQRQLDEERMTRASERQDWEVRLRRAETAQIDPVSASKPVGEDERIRIIQETRDQTKESCRRDFEVRRHMEHQDLQAEINRLLATVEELSNKPATSPTEEEAKAESADLRLRLQDSEEQTEQLAQKVADLEDQLYESRQEHAKLEEELAAAQQPTSAFEELVANMQHSTATIEDLHVKLQQSHAAIEDLQTKLQEREHEIEQNTSSLQQAQSDLSTYHSQLDEAHNSLQERDSAIHQLEQDLGEAMTQLPNDSFEHKHASLQAEVDKLTSDHHAALQDAKMEKERITTMLDKATSQRKSDLEAIASLRLALDEAHRDKEDVFTSLAELEKSSLQTERSLMAEKEQLLVQLQSQEDTTKLKDRITFLEREVSDRGLTILKLTKAKEVLEDENSNYGIALSAKQLELSMLKRNARIALGEATPQRNVLSAVDENATPQEKLVKGLAALKATRRRTMGPTVISVGRLRPKTEEVARTPLPSKRVSAAPGRISVVATLATGRISVAPTPARTSAASTPASARTSAVPMPANRRRSNAVTHPKATPNATPLRQSQQDDDPMRLDELANELPSTASLPAPRRTAPRRSLIPI